MALSYKGGRLNSRKFVFFRIYGLKIEEKKEGLVDGKYIETTLRGEIKKNGDVPSVD